MASYTVRAIRTEDEPESGWSVEAGAVLLRTDDLAAALEAAQGFMRACDPNEAAEIVDAEGRTCEPDHGDTVADLRF